jgi:hypothetical protein
MLFGASIQSPGLIPLALVGIPLNAVGILLSARLYRRYAERHPLRDLSDLVLARGERRIVWALILLLYALMTPSRADAFPSAGPFMLGMLLLVGSLWLLRTVAQADAGRTPPPNALHYDERRFVRYVVRFGLASLALVIAGLALRPVSTWIVFVAVLLSIPIGDGYMLRLAWRSRRARQQEAASAA